MVADPGVMEREARFEALINQTADVMMIVDTDLRLQWASENIRNLLGYEPAELVGVATLDLVHPEDVDVAMERMTAMLVSGSRRDPLLVRARRKDGGWHPVEGVAADLTADPRVRGIVVTMRDVSGRVERQRAHDRLIRLLQATSDFVVVVDGQGELQWANPAATQILRLGQVDPKTFRFLHLMPEEMQARFVYEVVPCLEERGLWSGEVDLVVEGSRIATSTVLLAERDGNGKITEISAVSRDIRERKEFEHELRHRAMHDPLTGLPNRLLLLDRLETAVARSQRDQGGVAVLFCDLDRFKVVNDSLGHRSGDELLRIVATRLETLLRPGDTVARFGGDEFVLLCTGVPGQAAAEAVADRVSRTLSDPIMVGRDQITMTFSVGISFTQGPVDDPESLIRDADAAMYRAKDQGRARFEVFDQALRRHVTDRLSVETELRSALAAGHVVPHYQPKIDLRTGRMVGTEALARWRHPERGLLYPEYFIDVAEESGLIIPLGRRIMRRACEQAMAWQRSHPHIDDLFVCVNMSARELGQAEVVNEVASVIEDTGIDPGHLDIEVTESVLLDDVDRAVERLGELKDLGVKIVVDDFGTGYSSLTYLRQFPVDLLKIDRSFVDGLGVDDEDTTIVTAVVGLAHSLGLGVIGEGVETAEQLEHLRALDCEYAQGFHLGRPMSAGDIDNLLATDPVW